MPVRQLVTKREIEQAFEDFKKDFGGVKEDYFGLLYLAKYWEKPAAEVASRVAFGNNDYGLDGFWIDREGRSLHLYQFKWTQDHGQFKGSLDRLIRDGIARIFGNLPLDSRRNPFLVELSSRLAESASRIDKVFIHFVFDGDASAAERSKVLESLQEDLESKKHFIDAYFERNVSMSFQFLSNRGARSGGLVTRKTHRYEVDFQDSLSATNANGEILHVGLMRLADLLDMYREMGPRMLSRNIRFGLAPENAPNRMLRAAFKRILIDEVDPASVFTFNHNGVTLSAENVSFSEGRCTLTEPRVLNGAQTLTSLAKFMEDNGDNPALTRNRDPLRQIRVLAKVISEADDDFIVEVTVNNNRQNPVAPWTLRASDRIQLELQDKFLEELGIFYERQEGAYESLSEEELEDLGVEDFSKAIQIRRLAQTLLAIQGEVDRMSRLPEVFESERLYRDTFRESYVGADKRKIVLAYKIQLALNSIVREMVESHASKYDYFRKGRTLVWALLVQGVLNDSNLPTWLDQFGTSLVKHVDYNIALRRLASGKVWSLLKDAFGTSEVEEQVAAGKWGFLRTKATYMRCMNLASEKYGWVRKSL
jgi:hypothetical protein